MTELLELYGKYCFLIQTHSIILIEPFLPTIHAVRSGLGKVVQLKNSWLLDIVFRDPFNRFSSGHYNHADLNRILY